MELLYYGLENNLWGDVGDHHNPDSMDGEHLWFYGTIATWLIIEAWETRSHSPVEALHVLLDAAEVTHWVAWMQGMWNSADSELAKSAKSLSAKGLDERYKNKRMLMDRAIEFYETLKQKYPDTPKSKLALQSFTETHKHWLSIQNLAPVSDSYPIERMETDLEVTFRRFMFFWLPKSRGKRR